MLDECHHADVIVASHDEDPLARHNVCLAGTHWHRQECAQKCAKTESDSHHPAANANHETNRKRPEKSSVPGPFCDLG
jgi:hypothetical protein